MPRQGRLDAPGALHHIIIRGNERRAIFRNDQDRDNFLERLGNILIETATPCFAWCLMKNHVHLLLRTGDVPLSTIMRRLLTGYAQQFNRRYKPVWSFVSKPLQVNPLCRRSLSFATVTIYSFKPCLRGTDTGYM